MDERPKTIPEIRGFGYTPVPRADTDGKLMSGDPMYSASSYAAMYGISVEEAEQVIESCNTHTQADRMISSTLAADPQRLHDALAHSEQQPRSITRFPDDGPASLGAMNVPGFTTPAQVLGEHAYPAFTRTSRRLVESYGKETADELVQAALADDAFDEWMNTRIAKEDHNLTDTEFHLQDVPERSHEAIRYWLANMYLESLIGE